MRDAAKQALGSLEPLLYDVGALTLFRAARDLAALFDRRNLRLLGALSPQRNGP